VTVPQHETEFDRAVQTLQILNEDMPADSHIGGPRGLSGPPHALSMETLTAVAAGLVDPSPGHAWSSEDRRSGLAALGAFLNVQQAADGEPGVYLRFQKPWLSALVDTLLKLKAK
jgi:hypothetical protein